MRVDIAGKIKEVLQGKETGIWEEIENTVVKFKGRRPCPGLTLWYWLEMEGVLALHLPKFTHNMKNS